MAIAWTWFGLASDTFALQSRPVVTTSDMNGNGSKIEIFKPFGDSFELMKKILFQPFDLKKWLIIGFAAWLANLGSGGGGGSFNYPENRGDEAHKLNETIGQIPHPVLITGICVLICVVLLLIVLFAWLRARGRFILMDCIVRNRAAVVEPWKEFRAEGNSFFLFSLLVVLVLIRSDRDCRACAHCAVYPLARSGTTEYRILDRLVAVRVFVALPCFRLGLISQLMVPIMYRQRCRARLAFAKPWTW
jgi:hypothetical protein